MRWHFNLFNRDSGKRVTSLQMIVYNLVNCWIPLIFYVIVDLVVFVLPLYIACHFIIKYW